MAAAESGSALIAWWGAGLSTLLAIVKVFELWRDRFRIDVSATFRDRTHDNEVLIRNLSSRPYILAHWELLYCSGHWPRTRRSFETIVSNDDFNAGDHQIGPNATHTLQFTDEYYFPWEPSVLNGRRIFIKLYVAGRKPILRQVYA
jgi:hypothetical protein